MQITYIKLLFQSFFDEFSLDEFQTPRYPISYTPQDFLKDDMKNELTGLIAATFTPLHANGDINVEPIPAITRHLAESGLTGIYINGSTGEGPSLTTKERHELAEAYVTAAADAGITSIVQVGSNSLNEARQLAEHAQAIGANAISSTPPNYFKPSSPENLADCIATIAGGAPELPYYYYHIPTVTGVEIDMEQFLAAAGDRVPTLAGIKFCSAVMHEMRRCITFEGGRYEMLSAWDEMLLSGLVNGAKGAVGSTYNFAAPIYLKMIAAVERADLEEARLWQDRALEMIYRILDTCGRAGLKGMMTLLDIDCGPHRLPIENASPDQLIELKKQMTEIGFFDWIKK
ncbi:MAG: N-acetylneuraminate lyase [Candidatus Promineifilaceae bacterium]|jgi:N-acetylneuraminate lyase